MDEKCDLKKIRQKLLNRFDNDFRSLTIAAYLQAQKQDLSEEEEEKFVMSILYEAKMKHSQTVIDLEDDLFL